jgi:hypothetical protein
MVGDVQNTSADRRRHDLIEHRAPVERRLQGVGLVRFGQRLDRKTEALGQRLDRLAAAQGRAAVERIGGRGCQRFAEHCGLSPPEVAQQARILVGRPLATVAGVHVGNQLDNERPVRGHCVGG